MKIFSILLIAHFSISCMGQLIAVKAFSLKNNEALHAANFATNAHTFNMPSIVYQPYTTCDTRLDSVVIKIGLGTAYTYSWAGVNTSPTSGIFSAGASTAYFSMLDSSSSAIIKIIVLDSICIDTMFLLIKPCCEISDAMLLTNTTYKSSFLDAYSSTYADSSFHISGDNFRINGLFVIDTDIVFTSCTFYMEYGSKIIVKSGSLLGIADCRLYACDSFMWKGILLENNSDLYVRGSYIADADTAIICMKDGLYHVMTSDFNRNLVEISILPNTSSINKCTLLASHLYCHNDFSPNYGNTAPPADGSLWYPHTGEKTHYGIFVRNNLQLQVGDSIDPINTRNKIEDMFDGVYSHNSGLQVKNCDFENMRRTIETSGLMTFYKHGNAIEFTTDSANVGYSVGLHAKHCTMDSIENACVY